MRKFYIQNALGERVDLNGPKYLFTTPSGLGLSYTISQDDISNGFYRETKIDYPAIQIMGDISFIGATYEDFRAFVNWLNKGSQLTFVYCPYGTDEYYCDINIESLGKTEIEQGTKLVSTMVAIGKTPWYKPTAKIINIVPDAAESSTWDLEWDVVWANNSTAGETSVSAGGHLPSAVKAVIDGPLYNPEILLLKDGSLVAKMALDDTTVQAGSVLTYSSLYTGAGVWIDGVSQIPALDLANENFFRIPLGGGYTLRITSEQSVSITGTVSIYDYYRSV